MVDAKEPALLDYVRKVSELGKKDKNAAFSIIRPVEVLEHESISREARRKADEVIDRIISSMECNAQIGLDFTGLFSFDKENLKELSRADKVNFLTLKLIVGYCEAVGLPVAVRDDHSEAFRTKFSLTLKW